MHSDWNKKILPPPVRPSRRILGLFHLPKSGCRLRLSATSDPSRNAGPFTNWRRQYAASNEANWPIARAYLVETRGIDSAIVDDLHAVGTIFSNDHLPNPSIVFLHLTEHGKVEERLCGTLGTRSSSACVLQISSAPGSRLAISIKRKSSLQSNLPSTP